MNQLYQQALAAMPVEDVSFILSQLGTANTTTTTINSSPGSDIVTGTATPDDDEENRRRRHIERAWPAVGTELTSDYCGVLYGAEIITATKRLKSGKQIRIISGAAKGVICDSFSEAMLTATEDQRNKQNLARKGVSNGWMFWQWEGKPESIVGGVDDADDD